MRSVFSIPTRGIAFSRFPLALQMLALFLCVLFPDLKIVWCNDDLHLAICDHPLFNTVLLYSSDGCECFRQSSDSPLLGPSLLQPAHRLPLLCVAGYESRWSLIDTQLQDILVTDSLTDAAVITCPCDDI